MQAGTTARQGDSGWATFAGVIMFIVGSLGALWGLGGILNDDIVIVGGHGAIVADITLWGWIHMLLGILVAATGIGLITGNSAARVFGVILISINAIAQIVWFPAAPLWSFLMIVLDVVILYQLTVRWNQQARWD